MSWKRPSKRSTRSDRLAFHHRQGAAFRRGPFLFQPDSGPVVLWTAPKPATSAFINDLGELSICRCFLKPDPASVLVAPIRLTAASVMMVWWPRVSSTCPNAKGSGTEPIGRTTQQDRSCTTASRYSTSRSASRRGTGCCRRKMIRREGAQEARGYSLGLYGDQHMLEACMATFRKGTASDSVQPKSSW